MLKHYVEFYYPGTLFTETFMTRVATRKYKNVKVPSNSFGFRFFDREEVKINGEILRASKKNFSGVYYFGTVYTLNQIKKDFPKEKILIGNVERTDTKKAIKTRCGNWQSFEKRDKVIGKS